MAGWTLFAGIMLAFFCDEFPESTVVLWAGVGLIVLAAVVHLTETWLGRSVPSRGPEDAA